MFLDNELYEFDLALSYASEDKFTVHTLRDYIRKKSNLKIYDYQENKQLSIFEYTPEVLKKIYSNKKVIMIMFLSQNYINKEFTDFESQFACQHLMKDKRLIVIKLDRVTNAWLPDMKDYMSLYDEKKNDIREIKKIGNIILDALELCEKESIEKLYEIIKKEIAENLLFCNVNNSDSEISISNHAHKLVIYLESGSLFLSEKFSAIEVNPMPIVEIKQVDKEFLMICTIPQISGYADEGLSGAEILEKLCKIINEIIK